MPKPLLALGPYLSIPAQMRLCKFYSWLRTSQAEVQTGPGWMCLLSATSSASCHCHCLVPSGLTLAVGTHKAEQPPKHFVGLYWTFNSTLMLNPILK